MNKYLPLFCIILFGACHHKQISKMDTASKPAVVAASPSNSKEVAIYANADMAATSAMYGVDSMMVKGEVLSVFVTYSGGCKEHSWELVSDGMFEKSLPPQITVCLKHTNNGDVCRELKTEEVKFIISKLKNPASKTVVVKLGEKSVRYSSQ